MTRRLPRRVVPLLGGVLLQGGRLAPAMSDKLDPTLAAMLADQGAEADREVSVVVGLSRAADDALLQQLRARGLQVRSVIGDVLTGAAPLSRMQAIAAQPDVVKIEAGGMLAPETPLPGG